MKKLIAVLLLSVSSWATTTVTGKIQTLGTGNVTTGAWVRFWLRGCGGNQPRIGGTSVIAPTQGGVYYFDIVVDGSGNVTGTLYSTRDAAGTGDGEIECGGSKQAVWYGMQVFQAGKGGPEVPIVAKNTATLDITQATPITTNPVVTAPTGDQTYARLDGGNQPFTGNISPSGSGVLSLGTTSNRWKLFGSTLDVNSGGTLAGTFAGGTFTGTTLTTPAISNPTTTGTDSGAETLTNKTLTAPAITSPSTTGTDSGTETLTNKTLTNPIVNVIALPEQTAPSGSFGNTVCYADSSSHRLKCSYNNNTFYDLPVRKAAGTNVLGSSAISSGACATTVTQAAGNANTSDVIIWSYASFGSPTTDGRLILNAWVSTNNVNFTLCNPTSGSITPTGLTVNWVLVAEALN